MEITAILAILGELIKLIPGIYEAWKKKDPTLTDAQTLKGIMFNARQYFADHGDPHPKEK